MSTGKVTRLKRRGEPAACRAQMQTVLQSLMLPAAFSLVQSMQCGRCLFHKKGRCSRTGRKVDPARLLGCEAWKAVQQTAEGRPVELEGGYLRVRKCYRVVRSVEAQGSVIFDFDSRGRVCGVEVLDDKRLLRALSHRDGYNYRGKKGGWHVYGPGLEAAAQAEVKKELRSAQSGARRKRVVSPCKSRT